MRLRVPLADLMDEVGAETLSKPTDFYRYALLPAAQDISAGSDLIVDFALVRAPSTRAKQMGKCRFVDITVTGGVIHRPAARSRKPMNKWGGPIGQPGTVLPMQVPIAVRRPTRKVAADDDDVLIEF